jgi:sugar lactone lactonase YvrE
VLLTLLPVVLLAHTQTNRATGQVELVWGRRGLSDGRFQKPRAMAIDDQQRLYIVDMTARIQVFDRDGNFLRSWRMPAWAHGKPTGLTFDNEGNLMVADTHYFRVLHFTPAGQLLDERTLGGTPGTNPGEFGFVTDAVQDSQGNYYVAEYGEFDRIQKFSPQGEFLFQWGGHGDALGQFQRPQNIAIDEQDLLWVADACNHRIQVFDATGDEPILVRHWGQEGTQPGQLRYPYDLVFDDEGHIYIAEFGNHRIQKFRLDGTLVDSWGVHGREPGQVNSPWALVRDNQQRLHILDTYNHRVQRIQM